MPERDGSPGHRTALPPRRLVDEGRVRIRLGAVRLKWSGTARPNGGDRDGTFSSCTDDRSGVDEVQGTSGNTSGGVARAQLGDVRESSELGRVVLLRA
jgi:hypothetical protein